ncbi:MAG: TetR/AcrR family transcriptional regulator [Thermomicrobiales bacterium]
MTSTDPRPARTRQRLFDALYQLAGTHDLTELSISEIARTAGVDRGSFYTQFADKQTFLDAVCAELFVDFDEMLENLRDESWYRDEIDIATIPSIYPIVARRAALYRQLLAGAGPTAFRSMLHRRMCEAFIELAELHGVATPHALPPLPIRAEFASAGLLALVSRWLADEREDEIDQYTFWAWEMLTLLGQRSPTFRPLGTGSART